MKNGRLIIFLLLVCFGGSGAPLPQCPNAREHSLALPSTIPPDQFVAWEREVLTFLQSGTYAKLGWCMDKDLRNTGPYQDGISYGPHPAVRIYYSPKVMDWLVGGRRGPVPDGATIVKEQYPPPAQRYDPSAPPVPSDWTVMIKDSSKSKDGWFWGEWYDGMQFDNDKFPFNYPNAGFGLYCLRCHASAEKEYTFAALENIKGFPGSPIHYPVDHSWQSTGVASALHGPPQLPSLLNASAAPNAEFLRVFNQLKPPSPDDVEKFPSETYDRVVSSANGPGQFLTSEQCMNCHSGLNGPFGPTMFLTTGPVQNGAYPGYNVSPYGEWRWSPMGLAGRDPIFYSQLDSELAFAKTQPADPSSTIVNTCMSCHGVMGKRQLDFDHRDDKNFKLDYINLTDRSNADFKYGSLARDGVSCTVCHHIVERETPRYESSLKNFLEHSITGKFKVGPPDQLYGQFETDTISTWPMKNGLGIKPQQREYIKSSRMCGSCHTIRLPVLDSPVSGSFSIEQATYLEWLNSAYQNEFAPVSSTAKTCQDCHMPSDIHNKDVDLDRLKERIAIIEDNTYPAAFGRAPDEEIRVRERKKGFVRHTLLGMNAFLLEIFGQFNDILGVRTSDYMSTSTSGLPNAISNYVQQAQSQSVKIDVSATHSDRNIDATVTITNLTGHRFPSGVGFRRVFIEFLVLQKTGDKEQIVWSSGRTNDLGIIVDGNGKILPSEFFTTVPGGNGVHQAFQPHHEVIDSQDQVQIYEELILNAESKFTTSFVQRDEVLKDNRLLPLGWTSTGPDPSLSGEFLESTFPEGRARLDPEYADGSGTDQLAYHVNLPSGVDPSKCSVRATVFYQSTPPYYLAMRFEGAPSSPATQRLYYFGSQIKLAGTPLENWKLPIVSAYAPVR